MNHRLKRDRIGAIDYFCISATGHRMQERLVARICNKLHELAFCWFFVWRTAKGNRAPQDEGAHGILSHAGMGSIIGAL